MSQVDRFEGYVGDLAIKAPVRACATSNITLSGLQTIDGVSLAADDRVLVSAQTSGVDNGVYIASTSAWTRSADCDGARDLTGGTLVYVIEGTLYARSMWALSGTGAKVPGTDTQTWTYTTVLAATEAYFNTLYVQKTSATGSARIPSGTTAQRDASPQQGYFRFNESSQEWEGYRSAGWGALGGGAVGGGVDAAFYENNATVFSSYTIGGRSLVSGVTMTIASPAVATLTNHGHVADQAVFFQTTGALPTGVLADTAYYVLSSGLTADSFQFSATQGGAAVNTSGTQSGTHSCGKLKNAVSAGPITIATGVTVTVSTGSTWTIV